MYDMDMYSKENIPPTSLNSSKSMPPNMNFPGSKLGKRDDSCLEPKFTWTSDEDKLLMKLAERAGSSVNWKKISENFEGKTEGQCRARLEKLMASEMDEKCKKKPWTEEEDAKVIELVYKHGPQKWSFIAEHLPGRIGKQCRERWHNHLNPAIKKTAWTDEEEWVLFLSHNAFGNKWAEISKNISGRTDNSIKNHWNSSMKKRIPELVNRFMKIKETGGLSNPKHIAGISDLEFSLLEKLLSMKNNSIVSQSKKNAAALLDTSKLKVAKSKSTNESKSRSMYTGNSMELKSFNSINKLVKHEYYAQQSSSETSSNAPSQFNSLKKVKKEEGSAHNAHQVKQEFSQEAFDISRDQHLKMLEQIYFPDSFSNKESTMATMPEVVRPYSGENSMRYTEEVPIFGVKKEEENGKKMFVEKDFSLIETSPAMKMEGHHHHHHYNIAQYNHMSHHEHNDENVNFNNFSDSVFFESPFHKKKSSTKFNNSAISPIDHNTEKSHSKILADKTNKMNTNQQSNNVMKDFFSYSPLNAKYESPSKMMSFCTPERLREPQVESLSKPLAFNLSSLEKSPSLFMNKNYYSFDKSSSYKF